MSRYYIAREARFMFSGFNFSKYRAIITAIMVFLILVLGILGSNFYISYESQAHTEDINIAGRQRMLSQRIAKALFDAEIQFLEGELGKYKKSLEELEVSARIFDDALEAFIHGDSLEVSPGKNQYLAKVETVEGQRILADAVNIWAPFKKEMAHLKEQLAYFETASFGQSTSSLLDVAVNYATGNDQPLSMLMEEVSAQAEIVGLDAQALNIVGRQRMLLQQVIKSLLVTNAAFKKGDNFAPALNELMVSAELFDNILLGLKNGSFFTENEEGIVISPLSEAVAETLIFDSLVLWKPLLGHIIRIDNVMQSNGMIESDVRRSFVSTTQYAEDNINTLLVLMDQLTNDIQRSSTGTAIFSRQLQLVGILLALLIFAFIAYAFFGQLRISDLRTEQATRETQQILDTVDQGLFLMDQDLVMSNQYSKEMEVIFADADIAGRDFPSYIHNLVSSKDAERVRRFFKLLFDPHKKQKLLGDLNPLKKVSVQIQNGADKFFNKYLRFSFSRISDENGFSKILTSVNDISEEVRLGLELEKATKNNEQQVEMLTTLISSDTDMLPLFIKSTNKKYEDINQLLKTPSAGFFAYKEKVTRIMALIHSVKGESGALSLGVIAEMCHEFEHRLIELRDSDDLSGNDFLSLAIKLDKLLTYNNLMSDLYEKVFSSKGEFQEKPFRSVGSDWSHLHHLTQDVARRQNKSVSLITAGLDSPIIDPTLTIHLNTISVQLIRNSIVHGIEPESQRVKSHKHVVGKISIALSRGIDGSYLYLYKDDGVGIDIKAVLSRAIKSGVITAEEAMSMSKKSVAKLILSPDISTANNTDVDGGRGVGMSAVSQAVDALGGAISISTSAGKGIVFKIRFYRENIVSEKVA
jgi:two-component sensor histidine kinase/HPt (histidine-containing phosphotransfer) domain-containing protein